MSILAISVVLIAGTLAVNPIAIADDDDDSPGGSVTLDVVERDSGPVNVAPDSFEETEVQCQAGEIVTGGGFHIDGGPGFPLVTFSDLEDPNGWGVGVFNLDPCLAAGNPGCSQAFTVSATVVCATLDGGVGNGDDDDDEEDDDD